MIKEKWPSDIHLCSVVFIGTILILCARIVLHNISWHRVYIWVYECVLKIWKYILILPPSKLQRFFFFFFFLSFFFVFSLKVLFEAQKFMYCNGLHILNTEDIYVQFSGWLHEWFSVAFQVNLKMTVQLNKSNLQYLNDVHAFILYHNRLKYISKYPQNDTRKCNLIRLVYTCWHQLSC